MIKIKAAYLGVLGPEARRDRMLDELGDVGERLKGRIRGPVGLDIGAKTPEEIAVSIMAEIVAFREGRSGKTLAMESRYLKKIADKVGVPS